MGIYPAVGVSADDQNEVAYNDMAICSVKTPEYHNLFI
jgi:hypothetical protein